MSQRYDRQGAQKEDKNLERSTKQMQSSRDTSYKNMLNKSWDFPTFPKITVVVTQVKYKVSILERHITKQLCILAFCMWTKIQSHSVQSPTVDVTTQLHNNNNNCLKSNIQCIEIRVQWTVHLGSSHMHVHAVTRVHAVTPKLVICVMYLTSI